MTARFPTFALVAAVALLAAGCNSTSEPSTPSAAGLPAAAAHAARWIPKPGTTYQIQYDGNYTDSVVADVYDIDMFDAPQGFIDKLHQEGRKVVCYISVGTWENWRPDAGTFPKSVIGNPDGGWKGERWLDVTKRQILEPIMTKRLQMCKAKHFDAVDPDNMDGYEEPHGLHNFVRTAARLQHVGRTRGALPWSYRRRKRRQRPSQGHVEGFRLRSDRGVLEARLVQRNSPSTLRAAH